MKTKLFARYPIGNPQRTWKQENFIISVANPGPMSWHHCDETILYKTRRGMETAVAAGFNMMETLWATHEQGEEILRTAERLGVKVVYQDLSRFGGMGFSSKHFHDDEDLEGVIRDTKKWNCIAGYYVYDEPTNEKQREITRSLIEVMEKECPHLMPYTVVAADVDYINAMTNDVCPAQLSFDIYPFGNVSHTMQGNATEQLDRSFLWLFYEHVSKSAKKINAPFWFYYQGHQLFYHPSFDLYSFAASRMMANAALLYGAKQISAYTEFDGYVDPETGGPGVFFDEQKKLNEETAKLGNVLMALDCHRVIHDPTVYVPDKYEQLWKEYACTIEDSELLDCALPPRISVSELEDNYGHKYLMVLNRDYRFENHFGLRLKECSRVYHISEKDGLEHLVSDHANYITGHLTPGSIALYRIQNAEQEPYLLEYYLEK